MKFWNTDLFIWCEFLKRRGNLFASPSEKAPNLVGFMNTWKNTILANLFVFFHQTFYNFMFCLFRESDFWYFYDNSMLYEEALAIFFSHFFLKKGEKTEFGENMRFYKDKSSPGPAGWPIALIQSALLGHEF